MATIPLPALHTAPIAQPTSPLEMYGQMMGIKSAQQEMQQRQAMAPLQQQQAQQQVQAGQMDLEQKQLALKDQQNFRQTMTDPANQGKTVGDIADMLARQGSISTQGFLNLKNADLQQRRSLADLSDAQLKNYKESNALVQQVYNNAMDMTPEQFQQNWSTMVGQINHIPGVQQMNLDPNQPVTQDQLSHVGPFLAMHNQYLDQETARRKSTADAQTAEAGADQKQIGDFAQQLASSPDQATYAQRLGELPMKYAKLFPQKFNKDAVLQVGMTPSEQAAVSPALAAKKAGAEAAARLPYEMALQRQRQALSQGDPNAAAQLLISGDATLSELKSRGATPDFIAQTLRTAHNLSGGQYNAQAADAQFNVAKSPANVAFFGSAKSLTDKGGTLDQLEAAAKAIPGGKIPAFNSLADWEKAATGSGPIAKYASLALGVADDYSKVMGGGQGSDTSRLQGLKLIPQNQSPEQRHAAVEGIRGAVNSQKDSRIGNNAIMRRMYGDAAPGGQGASQGVTVRAPNGKVYTFADQASANAFKQKAGIQ